MKFAAIFLFCLAALSTPAPAQEAKADDTVILARCGPSLGREYFFEGGVVGPGQGGWADSGISKGRLLVFMKQKAIHVLFKDVTGWRSHTNEGGETQLVGISPDSRTFLISVTNEKGGSIETFLFRLNEFGVGTVAWSSSRVSNFSTKMSSFTAECGPRFADGGAE